MVHVGWPMSWLITVDYREGILWLSFYPESQSGGSFTLLPLEQVRMFLLSAKRSKEPPPPTTTTTTTKLHVIKTTMIYWMIVLLFYVLVKNFSFIWRCHYCWCRTAKFRPSLGTFGLWGGRDLSCATPAVTRDLGFCGLIPRTVPPLNCLIWQARVLRTYSNWGPHEYNTKFELDKMKC